MKKTMKKLAAVVATAAVCCSMVVPGVAKAATCPPHYYVDEFVREFLGGMYDHLYVESMSEGDNGEPILEYATCWVDVMVTEYEKRCVKCQTVDVDGTTYEEKHIHTVNHPVKDE